jgi:hypothetical protein
MKREDEEYSSRKEKDRVRERELLEQTDRHTYNQAYRDRQTVIDRQSWCTEAVIEQPRRYRTWLDRFIQSLIARICVAHL